MKNHEWVDGQLLQTNKKYSHLKQAQKDKIHRWMYYAYKQFFLDHNRFPGQKDTDEVLSFVMERIDEAGIWIPYGEVTKHYREKMSDYHKRVLKEESQRLMELKMKGLIIEPISVGLSVCKVTNYNNIDLSQPFVFTGSTDQEMSLVCPTELVPGNTTNREDGWMAFRIQGMLDFSLVGILARITKVLTSNQIGIFAISTFNTDYIMVKEENFGKALSVLKNSGYKIAQSKKE